MDRLQEHCIEYLNLLLTNFKDENKMLVMELKNQNFKFNEIKRRIYIFIRSELVCLHKSCNNVSVNDIII